MRGLSLPRRLPHGAGAGLAALAPALSACSGRQSVLDPSGPAATNISTIAWIMFAGAGVIFALVVAILIFVLFRRHDAPRRLPATAFIVGGGVVLPVVTLTVLLAYTLRAGVVLSEPPDETPVVVEITGHQWWWEIVYHPDTPDIRFTTANELYLPVGQALELRLRSGDVIHSLWVPNLAGKIDLIPGRTNRLVLRADRTGEFRGQCAEYCGAQHAHMGFVAIALEPGDFAAWEDSQRTPAAEPANARLRQGRDAFLTGGCANCHTIRGTEAAGTTAPDLTHLGSRRTIAAGALPNAKGPLEAWIVNPQHFKPGNLMPAYNQFDGPTLLALGDYLRSLE